ncbi:MAG: GTP-binding protein [Lachnospiraceae bacterium]|nr:GTP-binding protein [Lachnospiraceae bacterium]
MIKIDIFSGFLGAGKTTLIKKLLADGYKGEKVVLIENEFGEIGIDGGFLKEAGVEITEMNSGCICCSLVGDFGEALVKVKEQFQPDRIIIEPSGVGKLSDVEKAVERIGDPDFVISGLTTVVDAGKCRIYMKNFGEFFNNQVEYAHTILLSRSQNVSEEKLQACVALLRSKNTEAVIVTTPWDELTGAQILEAMSTKVDLAKQLLEEEDICPECGHHHHDDEECCHEHHHHDDDDDDEDEHEHHHHHHDDDDDEHEHHHHHHDNDDDDDEDEHEHHHHHDGECSCGHDHHHHHADEVFTSWGRETPKKFDKEVLDDILDKLSDSEDYGIILRAKGIVPGTDGKWYHFDLTPGEYEIREGASDIIGRLCVIGSKLKGEEIAALFEV